MGLSGIKAIANHNLSDMPRIQRMYDRDRLVEPLITRTMEEMATELSASMNGLEFSVKTASSIKDKFEREQADDKANKRKPREPEKIYPKLKDIIRYTEICPHDQIFHKAQETIDFLTSRGYTLSGAKNYYIQPFPSTGYKGLHLNFVTPYGQEIELQVHSEHSFAVKQQGHKLYEIIRAVATPEEEKEKHTEEIFKVHGSVPNPPGYDQIENMKLTEKTAIKEINSESCITSVEEKNGCLAYHVYDIDGNILIQGAEITFDDGSVRTYRMMPGDREMEMYAVGKDGRLLAQDHVKELSLNIESVLALKEEIIQKHTVWMQEHFPNIDTPDKSVSIEEMAMAGMSIDTEDSKEITQAWSQEIE